MPIYKIKPTFPKARRMERHVPAIYDAWRLFADAEVVEYTVENFV